jgi:uncharacterized protein (TIRG00374 family)
VRNRFVPLRIAAGTLLLVALISYFGFTPIADSFARVAPIWAAAAALLIVVATFISAFNRYLLMNVNDQMDLRRFLRLYWLSWATGLLIPGQVGDIATLAALMRNRGMQLHQSVGRSVLDKLISFAIVGAFGAFAVAMTLSKLNFDVSAPARTIGVALLASALILLAIWQLPSVRARCKRLSDRLRQGAINTITEIHHTARRYPARVAINVPLSLLSFVLLGASYWCMFRAFGQSEANLGTVIPLVAACSLIAYIPVSFNGLGTSEAAGVVLFGQAGIPATTVISAFISLRLIVIAVAWLPAAYILLMPASTERPIR